MLFLCRLTSIRLFVTVCICEFVWRFWRWSIRCMYVCAQVSGSKEDIRINVDGLMPVMYRWWAYVGCYSLMNFVTMSGRIRNMSSSVMYE